MTAVRHDRAGSTGKSGARRSGRDRAHGATRVAQVRLRPDEMDALHAVMRTMQLGSTSDALREGLRLLAREAAEIDAAADLHAFYAGRPASLPDGTAPPTDAELAVADKAKW